MREVPNICNLLASVKKKENIPIAIPLGLFEGRGRKKKGRCSGGRLKGAARSQVEGLGKLGGFIRRGVGFRRNAKHQN